MYVSKWASLFVISTAVALAACGESKESPRERETTFTDKPSRVPVPPLAVPETPAPQPVRVTQTPAQPVPESPPPPPLKAQIPVKTEEPVAPPLTIIPKTPEPEEPSTLITRGELNTEIPEYRVPEKVRTKIEEVEPDLLPAPSTSFEVLKQHLTIDVKKQQVTFSGILRLTNKQDEPFELACHIDTPQNYGCAPI